MSILGKYFPAQADDSLQNNTKEAIKLIKESENYVMKITYDEYKQVSNDPEFKKELMDKARAQFNNKNIDDMHVVNHDRDKHTFEAWFTAPSAAIYPKVPSGFYDIGRDSDGAPILIKKNINYDAILPIHTELKDLVSKIDFKKKNNILIYGEPGNGKTQSIIEILKENKDMIAISISDPRMLRSLNDIHPDVKKLLIFEEFTETIRNSDVRTILNFLDGIDSVPNSISIMSTNYPSELEHNIIDRPSRVRYFIEYKNPNQDQIQIITNSMGVDSSFFFKKDYSVDNIMNIINKAKEDGTSLEEAEQNIKARRKFLSSTFKGGMGLGD